MSYRPEATKADGIDSLASIPGLPKGLKIVKIPPLIREKIQSTRISKNGFATNSGSPEVQSMARCSNIELGGPGEREERVEQ